MISDLGAVANSNSSILPSNGLSWIWLTVGSITENCQYSNQPDLHKELFQPMQVWLTRGRKEDTNSDSAG